MIKLGIHPINWSNDDFHELGGEISLQTCLSQMQKAGFEGTELGNKFPKESKTLNTTLGEYNLELISGWHSTYVLSKDLESEIKSLESHINFLKEAGSDVVILAECTRAIHGSPGKALEFDKFDWLTVSEWERLFRGLDKLAHFALSQGMKPVYHHHMGTVVQTKEHIISLMNNTKYLQLLLDTGHLMVAGCDPVEIYDKFKNRITHIHTKNIRVHIRELAMKNHWDFRTCVSEGIFTVPGDGGMNYLPLFERLKNDKYKGWLVVEAEQDPKKADPLEYALIARNYFYKNLQ